jgi:hypothetical protein
MEDPMADESGSSSGSSSNSNSQNQKKNQSSKKSNRGGNNRNRRGRRRYFRRKKGEDGQPGDKKKSDGKSGDNKSQSTEEKRRRARRNRRRRKSGTSKRSNKGPSIIEQIDNNYIPPESVYVYTHVLRPVDTMDSYEYRPEHFTSTDRSLGDFRIDLSPLFGDDDSPDAPIQLKISQPLDYSIFDDEEDEPGESDPGTEAPKDQMVPDREETSTADTGDSPAVDSAG